MHCMIGSLALVLVLFFPVLSSAGVDNSLYVEILEKYVKDGRVDYANLKVHRWQLDTYLSTIGAISLENMMREEQLAFYINLYNANTLQLIINNYPVKSIKDIGSFFSSPWKLKVVNLDGEMVTLDYVEHEIVRPQFKDPRVHFALNCSAVSCPKLLSVPFDAENIDSQLDEAVISFINDGINNYLDGSTLFVSRIFSWFSEDFTDDFVEWFSRYARGDLKAGLEALKKDGRTPHVKYLKYDWSLNRQGE